MVIENIMYFVLGFLVAGLLALIIIPAVWRRAVRLTKKRIEAATPMTMAEFRADKDQLRAEFALSTRRLEMNVEALRRRLADQLRDVNRKKSELTGMKGERDQHLQIVQELEEREAEARRRILELEKEGADLSQKLRMRERELGEKSSQLEAARETIRSSAQRSYTFDDRPLSGSYNADIENLLRAVEVERKRAEFLEQQNRNLLAGIENSNRSSEGARAEAASLRKQLAQREDAVDASSTELLDAEARIADAESRVTTILAETTRIVGEGERERDMLLAEKLSIESELEALRGKVASVEQTVLADWDSERLEQSHLRERLNDIAADVSRIVYALEGHGSPDNEESLLDRVQKYVEPESMGDEPAPVRGPNARPSEGAVSDRLKALRELQENG